MADSTITVRAGDTEPLEFTVGATDLSNLDDVSSVAMYFKKDGASGQHVDGASATVSDSANKEITFDPVSAKSGGGNAFDAAGTYRGYAKLTFSDGDITRHPAVGNLIVKATENQE